MAKTVDQYLDDHTAWRTVLERLRRVLLDTGMEETVKWGAPVYTLNGRNVVGIGAFKSYAGLWFFDGALLDDPDGVLINAQEGKTSAMRQWRFERAEDLDEQRVGAYVEEAMANARAGKRIEPKPRPRIGMPELLADALGKDAALKKAFEEFPPGKQREFMEHIAEAKREDTRRRRLQKILPMIARGEGLNDRYRNC